MGEETPDASGCKTDSEVSNSSFREGGAIPWLFESVWLRRFFTPKISVTKNPHAPLFLPLQIPKHILPYEQNEKTSIFSQRNLI